MRADAVVIGAGIFGSLIARALRRAGISPLVFDAAMEGAASPPAACLMRPSWFSGLGKDVYEPALKILDELVGVQDLQFRVLHGVTTVHWCDPKKVLLPKSDVTYQTVRRLYQTKPGLWLVRLDNGDEIETRLVIVAAGIWTTLLFPEVPVVAQSGVAWRWPEGSIDRPAINVWAPYKQLVAFNRGDGLWVGDGSSLRQYTERDKAKSLHRCQTWALGSGASVGKAPVVEMFGHRPYVKDAKPCFFKAIRQGVWVATGGAKNGTLAAGWCADQIVRAVS